MIIPEIDQRNNFFKGKLVGPVKRLIDGFCTGLQLAGGGVCLMCLNFRGEASEADMTAFVRNIGAIVYGSVFFCRKIYAG